MNTPSPRNPFDVRTCVFNYKHIQSMYDTRILFYFFPSNSSYILTYPLCQVIAAWDLLQLPVPAADHWKAGLPKARQDDKAYTTALVERATAWKRHQQQSDENCSSSDETIGDAVSSRPSPQEGIDLALDGTTTSEYRSAVGDGHRDDMWTKNSPRGSHQSVPGVSREQYLRNGPRNGPKNEVDSASPVTRAKGDRDSIVGGREMEPSGDQSNR